MDNLKEQTYSASNPLDLMLDPDYMRSCVAALYEVGGNIGVGLDCGDH